MDDVDDDQPQPLNIIKRTSGASDRPSSSSSTRLSSQSQDRGISRTASGDTNESMGSVREAPGTSLPLTIPKKRRTTASRGGRFRLSAAAAASRRAMNYTDNFVTDDEEDDIGIENDVDSGPASIRSRYLQDAQSFANEVPSSLSRSLSEHAPVPYFYNGSTTELRSVPENIRVAEAGSGSHSWLMSSPRRGPSSSMTLDRFEYASHPSWASPGIADTYHQVPTEHPLAYQHSHYGHPAAFTHPESHPYARPPAMITSPDDGLPPLSPINRSATAIPFDQPQARPRHSYQHHNQNPRPLLQHTIRPSMPLTSPASAPNPDPQILVPIISVTPERRSIEGPVNSFWVAIELFAHVTQAMDMFSSREYSFGKDLHRQASKLVGQDDQGLYRYGYISDMNIKILPTGQSEILEVIGKSPSLITMLPGSRRLMVVHIHLDTSKNLPGNVPAGHQTQQTQKSDRLIEDLERQLGATSQNYLQVQLTYTHSGFPKRDIGRDILGRDGGCFAVRTTINTTATAVIMQQNTCSMWSPSLAPSSNPLLEIVRRHWGPAAASEMAQRIAESAEARVMRKAANPMTSWSRDCAVTGWQETPNNEESDNCEEVTPRAASRETARTTARSASQTAAQTTTREKQQPPTVQPPSPPVAPARKVWNGIRRVSSSAGGHLASREHQRSYQAQRPESSVGSSPLQDIMPPGCFLPRPKNTKTASERPRQSIPETAPRGIRRPVGMDTTNLQRLNHKISEMSLDSNNFRDLQSAHSGARSSSRSSNLSKKSGKWSWTGWFA